MKWINILLIVMMLMCGIGMVSAGNVTLFDDADTTWAQTAITDSGAGKIFALLDLILKYILILTPFVLGIMVILYRMMNNSEKHKNALAAMVIIIGVLLLLSLYYAIVGGLSPDISTIEI